MALIDDGMKREGACAYIIYASSDDANMRYLSKFNVSDPVLLIKCAGAGPYLIVPQMEKERASAESACRVVTRGEAGLFEIMKTEPDIIAAQAKMAADFVRNNAAVPDGAESLPQGSGKPKILIPQNFPYLFAKELEKHFTVAADRSILSEMRSIKTKTETGAIKEAQKVNDAVMEYAVNIIRTAPSENGELRISEETGGKEDAGQPLTSDYLRGLIESFLIRRGYQAKDTIVSCGPETAMPHNTGHGVLCENEPIVLDIFPQNMKTGYFADMTRTVLRGEADPELVRMYNCVLDAKILGKSVIRAGAGGDIVHNAVLDFFEKSGYHTETEGFIHSLGHGVGLDIHEAPSLSPSGKPLRAGEVVTVEPGLYYRGIGGVRLEDMGIVKNRSFECFTKYEDKLIL